MLGKNYASLEDFKRACEHDRVELDSRSVLSKIYSIDQLRHIAKWLQVDIQHAIAKESRGINRRYDVANAIADARNTEQIGQCLSHIDHRFYFPVLTYLRISDIEQSPSPQALLTYLRRVKNKALSNSDFEPYGNGMIRPPGRYCQLESVHIPNSTDSIISLLFSCTRVLIIPGGQPGSFEHFFLTRIPVIVRILYRYGLVEVTMPIFSEPACIPSDSSHRLPDKYQVINLSTRSALVNIVPYQLRPVNFPQVTLYLETCVGAVDMGWRIEPLREAEFDLTQGTIPLKKILTSFSESLRDECSKQGLVHPLTEIDIYQVFRALKEQSYTYSFVLDAPLGHREENILLQTFYGPPNSGYDPVLLIPKFASIVEKVREVIQQSQIVNITNPYNLKSLLSQV
ncbi:MAG: hypothetical protein ACFFCP_17765 [Promethearchaeota archaeon]